MSEHSSANTSQPTPPSAVETHLEGDALAKAVARWRDGLELESLIDHLGSDIEANRKIGAFYLIEAVPRSEMILDLALRLARDDHFRCRHAAIRYFTTSGRFNNAILLALLGGLLDAHHFVRTEAIQLGTLCA